MQFSERTNKNRHKRIQHGTRVEKYKCLECNGLFYSKYSVKIHCIRKHDGIFYYEKVTLEGKHFSFVYFNIILSYSNAG